MGRNVEWREDDKQRVFAGLNGIIVWIGYYHLINCDVGCLHL